MLGYIRPSFLLLAVMTFITSYGYSQRFIIVRDQVIHVLWYNLNDKRSIAIKFTVRKINFIIKHHDQGVIRGMSKFALNQLCIRACYHLYPPKEFH